MNAVFKKLNLKAQKEVIVINSPESFERNLQEISSLTRVKQNLKGLKNIFFILIFVTKKSEIDRQMKKATPMLKEDVIIWFAYPKKTSKKYTCDINRDSGWESLGEHGYEAVRMVSIDEDWSALRFRKVEYIKKMIRRKTFAMTKDGKNKTKGN